MKKIKFLSARLMAFLTCSLLPVVASADATAPDGGGDITGGVNFINWAKTALTEYAWAIALLSIIPLAITFFIGGHDAGEKGKHRAFHICIGIFVLCCGNAVIQAARTAFGA